MILYVYELRKRRERKKSVKSWLDCIDYVVLIAAGDFNMVRFFLEKSNEGRETRNMKIFKGDGVGKIDCMGGRFTWFNFR